MKNKVRLKKYLAIISIISICILSLFLVIRVLEYKTYTNNFNNKLDMIILLARLKKNIQTFQIQK